MLLFVFRNSPIILNKRPKHAQPPRSPGTGLRPEDPAPAARKEPGPDASAEPERSGCSAGRARFAGELRVTALGAPARGKILLFRFSGPVVGVVYPRPGAMSGFSPELIDYLEGKISFEEFERRREERKTREKKVRRR